jgi:hypothetical protein
MAGLLRRLMGTGPKEEVAPPSCALDLPDGWAGGHGPAGYLDALEVYARAHPECADRVADRVRTDRAVQGLFMAAAVSGPDAGLVVSADDLLQGGELTLADELEAWVDGNLDALADDDELLGTPTASIVDVPYPGRVLRWSVSDAGAPPIAFTSYGFASAGRVWVLLFSSAAADAAANDETFLALASSFRVIEPATEPPS